jgi:hypothetical protein
VLALAAGIDATAVAEQAAQRGLEGPAIGATVRAARVRAIADGLGIADTD